MNATSDSWNQIFRDNADNGAIDPNDRRGYKNRYITGLRDQYFINWFKRHFDPEHSPSLIDIGCGSGLSSRPLIELGAKVIGVDIAFEGLSIAPKNPNFLPVLVNGKDLPIGENRIDGAVSYVSLSYIEDDDALLNILKQLRYGLTPGAPVLLIEQTTAERKTIPEHHKVQRTTTEWIDLMSSAGFNLRQTETLRCGHAPLLYLLRFGLIKQISPTRGASYERAFEPILKKFKKEYFETGFNLIA